MIGAGFMSRSRSWLLVALAIALVGCTTIRDARGGPGQKLDPWEKWNRKVFNFNEDLDRAVLKPVAEKYTDVVPQPVRHGVSNFFGNFADAWSAINNILQGKIQTGFEDFTRVGANTLFGLFGFFDVATEMGLDKHNEDFGQTLGRYGVGAGAYVVLPVLGPSTVRDTAALPVDHFAAASSVLNVDVPGQIALTLVQGINTRASLLGATRVIDDISLDKYTFVRDAFLQRRRSLVFDGDVPDTPDAPDAGAPAEAAAGAANVLSPAPAGRAASAPARGASAPR